MIQYSHGYQAHYGYDAAGRKLSVRHIISPVNIYVPMGSTTLPENAFLEWRGFDVYADNIQYFMEKFLSVFPTRLISMVVTSLRLTIRLFTTITYKTIWAIIVWW